MSAKTKSKPAPATLPPFRDNSAREMLGDLHWEDIAQLQVPKNYARKRDAQADAMLEGAMSQYDLLVPAIVDRDGFILDGVARIKVAERLGFKKYPIFRVHHLTGTLGKAFSIAVNKIQARSGWDQEQLFANIDAILLEHVRRSGRHRRSRRQAGSAPWSR